MPNAGMFGPASMVLGQTINSFTTFLPPLADVRKAGPDDADMAGDVRLGEIAAAALALGVGAISSSLLGDPTPTLIAALVALVLIVVYETALRGNRPMQPKSRVILHADTTYGVDDA